MLTKYFSQLFIINYHFTKSNFKVSEEIQEYLNTIKHLSNSSIKKEYEQFCQAFKVSLNKGYIMRNPMNDVIKPKEDIIMGNKTKKYRIYFLIYSVSRLVLSGAVEVVIYNFLALLSIDTNINQFIKVYHIFYKLQ